MTGYDVTRLEPGGVVVGHYDGKLQTDGPWFIVYDVPQPGAGSAEVAALALIAPAHAVVSVLPCDGRCASGRGPSDGV